jgi:hypothetical protein
MWMSAVVNASFSCSPSLLNQSWLMMAAAAGSGEVMFNHNSNTSS